MYSNQNSYWMYKMLKHSTLYSHTVHRSFSHKKSEGALAQPLQ